MILAQHATFLPHGMSLATALILTMAICFIVRFVLLSGSLWMLLKMQDDLNYTIPGILGCAALASLCWMIPVVGRILGGAVLFLCVRRMTGGHFVDVRFTVGLSYAFMFLIQMLVLSAMPTPSPVRARTPNDSPYQMTAKGNAADSSDADDSDDDTEQLKPARVSKTEPKAPVTTNAASAQIAATNAPPSIATANTTPTSAAPAKHATDYTKKWRLKGIAGTGRLATAMIAVGNKTYTFGIGEKVKVDTGNGKVEVSMEEASQFYVVLNVDGEKLTLSSQKL